MKTLNVGTRVRARARGTGHTRIPGYLAGKPGVVVAHVGAFVFPDDYVEDPAHPHKSDLYTVAFSADAVFGGAPRGAIHADLFEEYLEPQE